jgi:CheY-like chemotaxis protein
VASVLVVDDDPAVRTTVKLMLERDGHTVAVAADGRAGIAALAGGAIHLLIVDLFMPGMDGIETIREVRKRAPKLPVIVMSGAAANVAAPGGPDFLAMAVKLGAIRSVQKPFKPRDITQLVQDCLAEAATDTGRRNTQGHMSVDP